MPSSSITKKALAAAMKELMAEQPLAKISINEIVERCDLNRNSFYYHFKDKFDLVNWIFYIEMMSLYQKKLDSERTVWATLDLQSQYFYENRDFYINALTVTGQNSFSDYYVELLQVQIQALFDLQEEEEQSFYMHFYAHAISAAMFRWIRGEINCTTKEFTALLQRAISGIAIEEPIEPLQNEK